MIIVIKMNFYRYICLVWKMSTNDQKTQSENTNIWAIPIECSSEVFDSLREHGSERWLDEFTQIKADIIKNIPTIVRAFQTWLFDNSYTDKIISVDIHTNYNEDKSKIWSVDKYPKIVIIITTCGKQIDITPPNPEINCPVTIKSGHWHGKTTPLVAIRSNAKSRPYVVVMDGESKSYARNQISTLNRSHCIEYIRQRESGTDRWSDRWMLTQWSKVNANSRLGTVTLPKFAGLTVEKQYLWADVIISTPRGWDMWSSQIKYIWFGSTPLEILVKPCFTWKYSKPMKSARACKPVSC